MRARVRQNAGALAVAAVGLLVVGWLGLRGGVFTDYNNEARPAFDALLGGHLLRFAQLAPAYGGSLVLRAPFALIAKLWGTGGVGIYRASAVLPLLGSAFLGVWLVARMRRLGRSPLARGLALLLCVANPITVIALESGHPEELLGAVLCAGAVLAAGRDRPIWAGVLLGLAIANKQWALLAIGPVLIALPDRRIRAMLAAVAVALVVLVPLAAAGQFVTHVNGAASPTAAIFFTPWQFWWFLQAGPHQAAPWISAIAHPLIVASVVPLTLLCALLRRRGTRRPRHEALLLLVLLLLLRCALDPWDNPYYPLPFLIALVVWEALTYERLPVLALAASLVTWFVFQWLPIHGASTQALFLMFAVTATAALVAITRALYVPGFGERLALRLRRATATRAATRRAELA